MRSLFIRWIVCCVLVLVGALFMPPLVSAADGLPIFYVSMQMRGDLIDLVEVNPNMETLTPVIKDLASVMVSDSETLADLSPVEWQNFERDIALLSPQLRSAAYGLEAMSEAGLETALEQIWEVRPHVFLFQERFGKCFSLTPTAADPDTRCYGAYQFSLFDAETQQKQIVLTMPYHEARDNSSSQLCYAPKPSDFGAAVLPRATIDQVLVHPTRDLLIVRVWIFHNCLNKAFVVDYSSDQIVTLPLPDVISLAWSPDATQLAYADFDVKACITGSCLLRYGTIDLATLQKKPMKELAMQFQLIYFVHVAWPDTNTITVALPATDSEAVSRIVWHDLNTQQETARSLEVNQFVVQMAALRADENCALLVVESTTTYLFPCDGVSSEPPTQIPYLITHISSDVIASFDQIADNTLVLLDASGHGESLDLGRYRDLYKAQSIDFKFFGAPHP